MRILNAATTTAFLLCFAPGAAAAPAAAPQVVAPATPPAAPPAAAQKSSAKADSLSGTWSGRISQVGRSKRYTMTITITGKGGTTSYPDQHCTGKLVRVGSSAGYTFFAETIGEGKFNAADKSGCLDGSITLLRSGDALVMGWLAGFEGKPIVAFGALALQPQ